MSDILDNVYLDELFLLSEQINARRLSEYKMQLAIAQNPHVKDPRNLWNLLEHQQPAVSNHEYIEKKFDEVGFENLKAVMRQNPRIDVKS